LSGGVEKKEKVGDATNQTIFRLVKITKDPTNKIIFMRCKMIKQFKRETISYNRKEINCCILKRYSSGFEKSKGYLIAKAIEKTDKGNISYTISEVTKKKEGVVYIEWNKLTNIIKGKNFLRIKLYTGKGTTFRYWILKNFKVSDFIISYDIKSYDIHGEIIANELKQTA